VTVDYVDFLFWKLIVICVLAFVWGVYCGATGRSLAGGRSETTKTEPPEEA
jgi:hypothetical protein